MLSTAKLREYASLRGLSIRDIEAYCELGAGHISNIFNGDRPLTEENHRKIVDAINAAYFAKRNGTFKRAPLDKNKNAIKEAAKAENTTDKAADADHFTATPAKEIPQTSKLKRGKMTSNQPK